MLTCCRFVIALCARCAASFLLLLSLTQRLFFKDILIFDESESMDNMNSVFRTKFADLTAEVFKKQMKKRALGSIKLQLGAGVDIGIKLYCMLRETRKESAVFLDKVRSRHKQARLRLPAGWSKLRGLRSDTSQPPCAVWTWREPWRSEQFSVWSAHPSCSAFCFACRVCVCCLFVCRRPTRSWRRRRVGWTRTRAAC